MKTRDVAIFSGHRFAVPQGIQRIDTKSTHGWQVRYQGTKMFSDHSQDGSGANQALVKATKELLTRIANLPVPDLLQRAPSASKTTDLPSGISGPIVRSRAGSKVRTCNFSVLLPQFGRPPKCTSVYIGSENTYTVEKHDLALVKALTLRHAAELAYEEAATKAKRKAGVAMRKTLKLRGPAQ